MGEMKFLSATVSASLFLTALTLSTYPKIKMFFIRLILIGMDMVHLLHIKQSLTF